MNIGHPGERSHPSVLAAKKSVFDTAMRMGKAVRAEIQSIDEAREYLDMGVRHFSLGTDMRILHNWWKHNGELLRASMADALTGKSFVAG
jgi:4-hydroxy-2-oxoheptanedioate aldolase